MYLGVAYYPEHWERNRWERDAKLMAAAGLNLVRMAEFAWIFMEPREGRFEFEWLDEALATLDRHEISAILGTPTASMPGWVARKYPETLALRSDNTREPWGTRKQNCLSSEKYRSLSQRITKAMAAHFTAAPNVIGWQIDNELSGPDCYCDFCRAAFQDWLRKKYGDLDTLNQAWGTHFWGHRLHAWEEISIPGSMHACNPGACLDWRRHRSDLNVSFQREQVRIIRELCPNHLITHNMMGLHKQINYYDLAEDLDIVGWDNYPISGEPETRYASALAADVMRGVKRKNYWIMEQTAGAAGWSWMERAPRPGEIRNIAWQQLARGADAQLWFRWRTCTAGREQYWHGVLGHDGEPGRRYAEISETVREMRGVERHVDGATISSRVAIVYDYDSLWALEIQPAYGEDVYIRAVRRYYDALFRAGVNVDVVSPGAELSGYRLVLAPHLHVLPDPIAEKLNAYVRKGGVLLADCRTAVKDEYNRCHPRTLPGKLGPALGIAIEEYSRIPDGEAGSLQGQSGSGFGTYTAVHYADWISCGEAETLVKYVEKYLAPYAAVTRHGYGDGTAWYVGTIVREAAFYDALIQCLTRDAGIEPVLTPPEGVEICLRERGDQRILFLVNHTEEKREVVLPFEAEDLIRGDAGVTGLTLAPLGVGAVRW